MESRCPRVPVPFGQVARLPRVLPYVYEGAYRQQMPTRVVGGCRQHAWTRVFSLGPLLMQPEIDS
jgi:hypothetical protein